MDTLAEIGEARFFFTPRPASLPPDMRPVWRMTVILMLLRRCCRQERSSLKKLHVLNWAIRDGKSRQLLLDILDGRLHPDKAIVRFDPAMNRAIEMAKGEGLLEQVSVDRCQITAKGQKLADEAFQQKECLESEKWFIKEIAGKVTETLINRILGSS